MTRRTLGAVLTGAACALAGPAIVHAFTNDPADRLALSLMLAGAVVIAVPVGVRRSQA